jgi:anti-sigma regulatory factor (Ser/Thr protein kinase)
VRTKLTVDPGAPGTARAWLAQLREQLDPGFDQAALILSELVTNSVRHAARTDHIEVMVAVDGSRIRIEVSDGGPCFDAERARPADGRGLMIVARLAADWGVRSDGRCTVWAEIDRAAAGAPDGHRSRSQSHPASPAPTASGMASAGLAGDRSGV